VPDEGVAVKVTVAPMTRELEVNVGVLSLVILSELDEPESDAASSVGAAGAATVIPDVTMLRFENEIASFPNSSCAAYRSLPLDGSE
jgi:hypothetical protein